MSQNYPYVIGVDTHARTHTIAIVDSCNGALVATSQFQNTPKGLTVAVNWVGRLTGGDMSVLWAIEGCATYGAQLARQVKNIGYKVTEAPHYATGGRKGVTGKTDGLDAQRIGRAVLGLAPHQLRHPRTDDGERAALRILLSARYAMSSERTAHVNALIALLRAVDLGIDARKPLPGKQIAMITRWRSRNESVLILAARTEAVRLAKRITLLNQELQTNQHQMVSLLQTTPAAGLLNKPGIGPVTAAIAYTTWSHQGRIHNEAAYAVLAGVNPIPASSGNTIRHRLNRAGDRRLNHALHMAVISRMTHDQPTREYVQKRTAEGKTKREIRRILKRYLARQIYRYLNNPTQPEAT